MNGHVVIEWAHLGLDELSWYCRGVSSSAQEVDFDQVNWAAEDFFLFC